MRLLPDRVVLKYKSKGGQRVQQTLKSPRLHRVLQEIDDLPGAELLTWLDDRGTPHPLRSETVNEYLGGSSGEEHTAKTFRTWLGTLRAFRTAEAAGDGRLTVKAMATAAAEQLGNTPTIARTSYIHPDVIALADNEPEERRASLAAPRKRGSTACAAASPRSAHSWKAPRRPTGVEAQAEPEPGEPRSRNDFDNSRPRRL